MTDMEVDTSQGVELEELSSLRARAECLFHPETVAQEYCDEGIIQRLLFAARQTEGLETEVECLKIVHDEIKNNTKNTALYMEVVEAMNGRVGSEYKEDGEWISSMDEDFESLQIQLESGVTTAKSALDKVMIQRALGEYAKLLFDRGLYQDAMKQYLRMRDYCSTPSELISMTLSVVRCAIAMKNFFSVINHSRKIEAVKPASQDDQIKVDMIRCILGVTNIALGKFTTGVSQISEVLPEAIKQVSFAISPREMAMCVVLTALASFNRTEIHSLMSHNGFREILNTAPQEVSDAFTSIEASSYGIGLAMLESIKPLVWLHPFLSSHMDSIYDSIYGRCLCEYASVFSYLSLPSMAEKFNMKSSDLEARVVKLIKDGRLKCKIHGQAHLLVQDTQDVREDSFKSCLQTAEDFLRYSNHLVLRSSITRCGLTRTSQPRATVPSPSVGGPHLEPDTDTRLEPSDDPARDIRDEGRMDDAEIQTQPSEEST